MEGEKEVCAGGTEDDELLYYIAGGCEGDPGVSEKNRSAYIEAIKKDFGIV